MAMQLHQNGGLTPDNHDIGVYGVGVPMAGMPPVRWLAQAAMSSLAAFSILLEVRLQAAR